MAAHSAVSVNPEFVSQPPADARAKHAAELARRRNDEANDAMDFLFLGDEDGRHAERCVYALAGGEACSREYDPMPYAEAAPAEPRMYDGTGIGALYGMSASGGLLADLAGWNIVGRDR